MFDITLPQFVLCEAAFWFRQKIPENTSCTWYIFKAFKNVISNIALFAYDTTLNSKFDWASNFWQQQQLAYELYSDVGDSLDLGKVWLANFNAGKTQFVSFKCSVSFVLSMWKWVSLSLVKNNLVISEISSLPNLIDSLTLFSLLKLSLRSFFCLVRFHFISVDPPFSLAWNTVVLSGQLFPVLTWMW